MRNFVTMPPRKLSPATRKFLEKTRARRLPPRQFQPRTNFNPNLSPPNQPTNMFAKNPFTPTPMESSMDLLFGFEGQKLVDNTQTSFPQLNTSDVSDVISSVQNEMFMNEQPRRMPMRRRRR